MRRGAKVVLSWGSALALILVMFPSILRTQGAGRGNLVGFIYGQDGSTPVEGAVVVVKNVTTGVVTESPKSDSLGIFKVQDLGAGIYALGVRSDKGSYNSQDFFGVAADKTAKITVALSPYDSAVAAGRRGRHQGTAGEGGSIRRQGC